MDQLMFDINTNNIVNAVPNYSKIYDELNDHIKHHIEDFDSKRYIYILREDKCLCNDCFNELDNNNYCTYCKKQYFKKNEKLKEKETLYLDNEEYLKELNTTCDTNYFIFDVIDNNILLYLIESKIKYFNTGFSIKKLTNYKIEKIYHITKNYYNDILENNIIYYKDILKKLDKEEIKYPDDAVLLDINLDKLNNTIYKYINPKNYIEKLNYNIKLDLKNLVIIPLNYSLFERLIKLKLYNLAFECYKLEIKNNSFYGVLGVGEEYLTFLQDSNLNYNELLVLQKYKYKDKDILEFIVEASYYEIDQIVKLDYKKAYNAFKKGNLDIYNLGEYRDYLSMALDLGYNMKDNKVLYPENLIEEHNKLLTKINILEDPDLDIRIKNISNNLIFNIYEDDKYIIFPAESVESMVEEASNQQNCLVSYCDSFSRGDCEIYFLREKANINNSLVTIEVKNKKIIQARCKYNEIPDDNIKKVLKKFEKTLVLEYINE